MRPWCSRIDAKTSCSVLRFTEAPCCFGAATGRKTSQRLWIDPWLHGSNVEFPAYPRESRHCRGGQRRRGGARPWVSVSGTFSDRSSGEGGDRHGGGRGG